VRTTLTLDDDVANLLHKEVRQSKMSFKQAVNHFLRQGLMAGIQPPRRQFVVKPRRMGLPPGLTYDNIGELLDVLEGAARK